MLTEIPFFLFFVNMVTPSPSRCLTVMRKKQNAKRTKKDNTDCPLLLLSSPDKHSSYSRYYRFCCGSNTSGGLTSFFGYNLRYNLLSSEPASSLSLLLCSIAFFILSIARIFQKSSNFLKFSIIFSFRKMKKLLPVSFSFPEIYFSLRLYVKLISGYPVFVPVHGTERTRS